RVNEFESGFLEDFAQLLKRLVPRETYYPHDDWDKRTENIRDEEIENCHSRPETSCEKHMESANAHSHCMSMLLGTAGETIPVRDGELCLGTWQRVLFLELDRDHEAPWIVQVVRA